MPVVIPQNLISRWLSATSDIDSLTELLQPIANDFLTVNPVSDIVNTPKVDNPHCVEPLQANGLFEN